MPLVYEKNINLTTRLGVWHITEAMDFFAQQVPIQTQIKHPHKQLQHLAGRYLLKELYPDFPYALIRIADTKKPFLENDAYHFSISHCGDYAAVIVSSTKRVGIDIELVTEKVERIMHKFLSLKEQQLLKAIESSSKQLVHAALLTAAWGIKESLFKWYGDGQVDFKKHLHINQIKLTEDTGVADCSFRKNEVIHLPVQFLFLNSNCLSWVIS